MNARKLVSILLGTLSALAMMATSASALTLPDISVVLGGSYPLHAEGEDAGAAASLSSASGVALEGKGASLSLSAKELTALGIYSARVSHVKIPGGSECNEGTEPTGLIAFTGEGHLVPINLTGALGALALVTQFKFTCGTATFTVRGNVLGEVTKAGTEATELTEVGGLLEAGSVKGENKITKYYNDGGTLVETKLESDAGLEFVKVAVSVAAEVPMHVLGSQMVQITGRL